LTDRAGRYVLRHRTRGVDTAQVRVRFGGDPTARASSRVAGRLSAYRPALASWYGPGLYGNALGCGGRLSPGTVGVAHKSLPCGTRVTFRHRGRTVRVPVIDRGPYVGGREYDLTAATARRLGFQGHGAILATR
jgi:rare lipoprotein A (peptidoglycan hydrolase)